MKRLVVLALVLACAGCSTTEDRHRHLFDATKILLRHVTPEPGWAERKEKLEAALEIEAPTKTTTTDTNGGGK